MGFPLDQNDSAVAVFGAGRKEIQVFKSSRADMVAGNLRITQESHGDGVSYFHTFRSDNFAK
jgi:hypothetical protein